MADSAPTQVGSAPSGAPDAGPSQPPSSGTPDAGAPSAPDGGGGASSDVGPFVRTNFGVTADPSHPPPPLSGGTLTVLAGGKLAVASDPDRDHVYVADLDAWKVVFDVALAAHDEPGRVAEGPAGTVFVALRRGGAVATLDTRTGLVTERRAVCSAPRGLAYDPAAGLLHVACAGGELVSLPATGGPEARRLVLDDDLRDVVVSAAGLYVSRFRAAEILVVSAGGAVTARLTPVPTGVKPAVAWRLRGMADGSLLMVHQAGATNAIPVDGDPNVPTATVGTYRSSSVSCSAIVGTMVTIFDVAGTQRSMLVSGPVLPVDVAVDPRSGLPAVVHAAAANTPSTVLPLSLVNVGASEDCVLQQGLQDSPDPPRPPGQVVAIEASDAGALFAQTREPATLWRDDGRTLTLSDESHADVGHALFHADVGGLACASCHPEGGEDGRVWKFSPIGLRRTPSLRGGIAGTAPFHWNGNLPTMSSLMSEVFTRRMAGPVLAPDQVDALSRWIDAIPALPPVSVDAAAVARGRALFTDPQVACATCHAGALLTNNVTVDVGTGQAFQVPSLRGVAWRAPYLHDGCAPSLADRFGACGGGDRHGHTSDLTPAQLADLVSYLRSL